jgi:peptide chain release factor 1
MEDYLKPQIDLIDQKIKEAQKLLSDPEMESLAKEEIQKLEEEKKMLAESFRPEAKTINGKNSDGELNERNAIIEVRGAAGGEEAKIWASDLFRMYLRYAENQKFKSEILEDNVVKIKAKNAFGIFKFEAGVHRVQRIPTTESSGRIHTSTATVAILPELEDLDLHIGEEELKWEFYRSGGHGGQNVNKVSTAVRLTHIPTNLVVTCQTERYQAQNREIALKLLRAKLWEQAEEEKLSKLTADRKAQIGRGMRAEKIRTYNFPQDRVTDHRINQSWHNLEGIMEGDLKNIINSLSIALPLPEQQTR